MNKLRISLLQTDICWENKEYNLRRLHEKLEKLSGTTEIVVLPEMFSTGFSMNCHDLSEPVSGATMQQLCAWANHYNNRRLGRWIKSQAAKLGFQSYIHLIDNDIYRSLYLKEYLRPGSQGGFHGRTECSVPGKMQEVFVPPDPGQGSQRGVHAGAGKGVSLPASKVSL